MVAAENGTFDAAVFLKNAGLGRRIVQLKPKDVFFAQGNPADSVFYLQTGRAKADGCFEEWQRGYHYSSLSRRFRWRRVDRRQCQVSEWPLQLPLRPVQPSR